MTDKMSGGRPRSLCWDYVQELETQNNKRVFECKGIGCGLQKKCDASKSLQAAAWNDHLVCDCRGANITPAIKVRLANSCNTKKIKAWKKDKEEAKKRAATATAASTEAQDEDDEPPSKKMKQPRIDEVPNFVDHCDDARASIINQALMRFICGCGLAFNLIDSSFFRDFVKSLNQAYARKMPKQDAFRNTHLPDLYNKIVQAISRMWYDEGNLPKTFGFDGYTDKANGNQVVNCTETVSDKTAFVACIDPEGNSENAEFLAKTVIEQIEKVKDENPPRSVEDAYAGIVADNTQTNLNAFDIVKAKYPRLFTTGCATHVSDLMMEDIFSIDELNDLMK